MSGLPSERDAASTVGWEAINAKLESLYPKVEPSHWGTLISFAMGGPDPLDGISAYLHDDGQHPPHWHFVSYGMSELYDKVSDNKEYSGWGFEFTFRLRRAANETEPPQWPLSLLQNLARYVCKTGNVFAPGHYLPLNGPIALGRQTLLHAAMFCEDPELGTIQTPHGKLQFLQLVGATLDEMAAGRAWNTANLLEVTRRTNPLLLTDLDRESILSDAATARIVAEATAREGSSSGWLMVRDLRLERIDAGRGSAAVSLVIGASGVSDLRALLRGRTGFGRDFQLVGPELHLTVSPAESFSCQIKDGKNASLALPVGAAKGLADVLEPKRGIYRVPDLSGFHVRVVPTEIKDATGQKVIEVIG